MRGEGSTFTPCPNSAEDAEQKKRLQNRTTAPEWDPSPDAAAVDMPFLGVPRVCTSGLTMTASSGSPESVRKRKKVWSILGMPFVNYPSLRLNTYIEPSI